MYNEKKECCIIDPGCYFSEERDRLKTDIEKTVLKPVLLLNTHCHLDHIFGNKFVHETWGLDLHLHEKEKPVLDIGPASGLRWQLPFENYEGPLIYIKEGNNIKLGDDEQARDLFEEIINREPGYVGTYYHLAKLQERLGETDKAVQVYKKGMEEAMKAGDNHAYGELKGAYEELTF